MSATTKEKRYRVYGTFVFSGSFTAKSLEDAKQKASEMDITPLITPALVGETYDWNVERVDK